MSTEDSPKNIRGPYMARDETKFWQVHKLTKENLSLNKIAEAVGMNRSTVQNIVKRIRETGSPMPRKSTGAPRKVDVRAERHLERLIREDPFASYNQLKSSLAGMGIVVCKDTVISSLKRLNLQSPIAAKKPLTIERHKKARIRSAKRANLTDEQWKIAVLSEELHLRNKGKDSSRRLIRRFGKRYE